MEKILISGAGIAGLSAAAALSQAGIPFRIIERNESFEQRGYAMTVQGEGLNAAEELGIIGKIRDSGVKRVIERIEDCQGRSISERSPDSSKEGYTIARNDLHRLLMDMVTEVEFGNSITEIRTVENRKEVLFSDGSMEVFDLVVAADGINSALRSMINSTPCVFDTGLSVWNVKVKDYSPAVIEVWDKKKIAALYPLPGELSVSFFVKKSFKQISESGNRKEDILLHFKDCTNTTLKRVLEKCGDEIFFGSVRNVITPVWYKDGILLIGDAAHGISPLSGMGANLAMADAVTLGKVLSNEDLNMESFVQYRKKEAYKAFKTGEKRKRRALRKAPLSVLRDRRIKFKPWIY